MLSLDNRTSFLENACLNDQTEYLLYEATVLKLLESKQAAQLHFLKIIARTF